MLLVHQGAHLWTLVLVQHGVLVLHCLVAWYTPLLRSVNVRDWFPFPLVDRLAGADDDLVGGDGGGRLWGGQGYVAREVSFLLRRCPWRSFCLLVEIFKKFCNRIPFSPVC